jgi:hypothetical protein
MLSVSCRNCAEYGLQQLLEVEDLCDARQPDERSVMTYIASFFHAFSSMGNRLSPHTGFAMLTVIVMKIRLKLSHDVSRSSPS